MSHIQKYAELMVAKIKTIYDRKDYVFFDGIYDVNLIGIRKDYDVSNAFNDRGLLIYKNGYGDWRVDTFSMTTDPGVDYTDIPIHDSGVGVIVPNQYRGVYVDGLHKGKKALIQNKDFIVYRDSNRDRRFDKENRTIAPPSSGFNFHSAPIKNGDFTKNIGKFSAGCQVVPDIDRFAFIYAIVKRSMELYGPSITYTLLESKDF